MPVHWWGRKEEEFAQPHAATRTAIGGYDLPFQRCSCEIRGMAETLVFVSGKRTAFGSNGGSFRDVNPTDLGVVASRAAVEQSGVGLNEIDHVIFGNVLHSAPDSIYTPRHIGLKLGIPQEVPALGVSRLCGSGFQVIVEAFQQMAAGDTRIALVGGVENMSMSPYVVRGARWGLRMGHAPMADTMFEALFDTFMQTPMAITAEKLAEKYSVSREDADLFALRSQRLCSEAIEAGRFNEEIVPYPVLAKLKPVFKKDGVVTAGNASGIVDGAAAMVVMTEKEANCRGAKPLGRLVSYGVCGCDPSIMGIGPAPAAREALRRAGMTMAQMDLVEVNEAFSPQAVAVEKELGLSRELLNANGGAIAIGHPLAASGTRIIMTLLYELRRRKKKFGLGSACIGGGQGIALVVEAF
jgi:acetyl-CoA acyltransferase 2